MSHEDPQVAKFIVKACGQYWGSIPNAMHNKHHGKVPADVVAKIDEFKTYIEGR